MKKLIIGLVLILTVIFISLFFKEEKRESNNLNYTELGSYVPQTYSSKDENKDSNYVSYYPKGGIYADMPVVIFIKGGGNSSIYGYSGIMKFLASKGYYVIGVDTNSYESWYVTKYIKQAVDEVIKKHNLKIPKLAVLGHSLGGGQTFYVLNQFLKEGYGDKGNLALSIDGWFPFNMNKKDFSSLNINASFLQMNGLRGKGTDPRIHLKIWNLLTSAKKSFYTLDTNNHSYVAGNLINVLAKKDLLSIIGALTDDAFNNTTRGQETIDQKNKASYSDVFNALQPINTYRQSGDCEGVHYNAINIIKKNDIDYCSIEKPLH